jgi:hypothetical protein
MERTVPEQVDSKTGDIDADPIPIALLYCIDSRTAATEGVEHCIARI